MKKIQSKAQYIVGLLFFLFIWLPYIYLSSLHTILWLPPKEAELTVLRGYIIEHVLLDCNAAYCAHPPYKLRLENNSLVSVHCELPPSINLCLYSNHYKKFLHKDGLSSKGFENKFIVIKVYKLEIGDFEHYIIMSVNLDGREIVSYKDSVDNIKNSELHVFKEGATQNESIRVPGHFIFWFMTFPLTLLFVFVLYKGLRTQHKLEG